MSQIKDFLKSVRKKQNTVQLKTFPDTFRGKVRLMELTVNNARYVFVD